MAHTNQQHRQKTECRKVRHRPLGNARAVYVFETRCRPEDELEQRLDDVAGGCVVAFLQLVHYALLKVGKTPAKHKIIDCYARA